MGTMGTYMGKEGLKGNLPLVFMSNPLPNIPLCITVTVELLASHSLISFLQNRSGWVNGLYLKLVHYPPYCSNLGKHILYSQLGLRVYFGFILFFNLFTHSG